MMGNAHRHYKHPPEVDIDEGRWRELANCKGADPDLFYPERTGSAWAAKAVCALCLVRAKCLEYALANNEDQGIWGGTSGKERRRMQSQRRQAS